MARGAWEKRGELPGIRVLLRISPFHTTEPYRSAVMTQKGDKGQATFRTTQSDSLTNRIPQGHSFSSRTNPLIKRRICWRCWVSCKTFPSKNEQIRQFAQSRIYETHHLLMSTILSLCLQPGCNCPTENDASLDRPRLRGDRARTEQRVEPTLGCCC